MSKAEVTSTCSIKGAGLLILKGEQTHKAGNVGRRRALREALREASSSCSIQESRGSYGRGTSTRVTQAKQQALKIVVTGALLMFLVGEKPTGWTQNAFFPPGSHQYALFLTYCFHCWIMQPLIPSAVSPLSLYTHQEHLMTNSSSEFSPYLISAVANRVQFHSKPLSVYLPRKLAGGKDKTFLRQKSLL